MCSLNNRVTQLCFIRSLMKVLHVITSLRTGGAEKLMVELLPRMKTAGMAVDLCVFDGERTPFYEEIERRGVKVIALGHSVYSLSNVVKLVRLMRQYDVVHSHNTACQYGVAWGSVFVKSKIVTTEHNTTNRRRSKVWRLADRWMYGRYDKIVCISELTKRNLLAHIGNAFAQKCILVYNGIDLSVFVQDKKYNQVSDSRKSGLQNIAGEDSGTVEAMYRKHHGNDKTVVMVSAFRTQKDQKTLIRAMKVLPEEYKLWLVGGGDERLIGECKELTNKLDLNGRVTFTGVRTDIPNILQAADVVVLSSHYEGLSLSSVEGMACGRPFVASDVEGLSDVVGGYGVLFPHGNHESLASSIKCLCEDEAYRAEVVSRCVARANMFDINMMADKYMNLYYAL